MKTYLVIGGGIVGLATARRILAQRPGAEVVVLEKEPDWGAHQTGHNSGVIHAGVYYAPGSLKARMARAGGAAMVRFCEEHSIPVKICGKLIVATDDEQVPRLQDLYERATANGLAPRMLTPGQAGEHEPEVSCVAAMHVPSTGIVDYRMVCRALAGDLAGAGATMRPGTRVTGLRPDGARVVVQTTAGDLRADALVNCAGLYADRVARMAGIAPPARIVPFRGEYFQLRPQRRHLVNGLIYPVPDPRFPFLGVHLTRMIDGGVHAGPNAVLALAREGYRWTRVNLRDVFDEVSFPGLWRVARGNLRYGLGEMRRSLSRKAFAAGVARLVPAVAESDLIPAGSGVRAQAVRPDGTLVDDFLIVTRGPQVHVLNAPSPAATAALEIAKEIVAALPS